MSLAELDRDSHGVFALFRRHVPIIMRADGARIVLRAADVRRLGSDPRLASPEAMAFPAASFRDLCHHSMLYANDDVHSRRRAPFSRLFSFPVMKLLRSEVAAAAHDLIDGWIGQDRFDLVASFATRLPLLVISRIFGRPDADAPRAMSLVASMARPFSGAFGLCRVSLEKKPSTALSQEHDVGVK